MNLSPGIAALYWLAAGFAAAALCTAIKRAARSLTTGNCPCGDC